METQTISIKRCLQYTEDTPLFCLLNNNELIVHDEERHSVGKAKSRRTDLLYLFHGLLGEESCGLSAYKRKRCALTPLNNDKSKPRMIIFINHLHGSAYSYKFSYRKFVKLSIGNRKFLKMYLHDI